MRIQSGTTGYSNPEMKYFAQLCINHMESKSEGKLVVVGYGKDVIEAQERVKKSIQELFKKYSEIK